MPSLFDSVALANSLTAGQLQRVVNRAPYTYRRYTIAKKKGGVRFIMHPSIETKMIQYSLMGQLEGVLTPHKAALGFVRGVQSPLKKNALLHADNEYFIKLDFADFFPSIRPRDLFSAISRATNSGRIILCAEDRTFLERSLFVENHGGGLGLPVGAPSSPFISNGVMYEIDQQFEALAVRNDFIYSRYADDLVFSTKLKNVSKKMLANIEELVASVAYPKLKLNTSKTRFMSRNCRVSITGIIVTPEGDLSIGRKNKRRIRSILNDFRHEKITSSNRKYLQGYLAFILDIEPDFYNRLCQKYGADVVMSAIDRSCAK